MFEMEFTVVLASVLLTATPLIFAVLGECLAEKAGVINLSLDGAILLAAMTAFAAASISGSLVVGFGAGAITGVCTAALLGGLGIYFGCNRIAVGFVLTLMCRDLAYFFGAAWARQPGPELSPISLAGLQGLPFFGPIVFEQPVIVLCALLLIPAVWLYMYRTAAGLVLRAVGDNAAAAYARGIRPKTVQMAYTLAGGVFTGLAGASFSLCVKPGWGRPQGAEGLGWIVLAIVIFGNRHPLLAALATYFFAFLQVAGVSMQSLLPTIPGQVFQVAPFPLMIFSLVVIKNINRSKQSILN